MASSARTEYARRYAARRREAKLARKNAHARTCQRRGGPGVCGGVLEDHVDRRLGEVCRTCPRCERRKAGICQDCPRPVEGAVGRAQRCAVCKRRRLNAFSRRWVQQNPERARECSRKTYQANPERRAQRNAYKRLYRQARRDQVKKEKYAAGIRHNRAREKMLAYHLKYNAERRIAKAEAMKLQYRADHPVPQPKCTDCARDIPWSRRATNGQAIVGGRPPVKCVFCTAPQVLIRSINLWVARTDIEIATPAPKVRRVRPWKPRVKPTRLNDRGDRLCWNESCQQTVAGREKKCAHCKESEQREALALLEAHPGRGRRTDLQRRSA